MDRVKGDKGRKGGYICWLQAFLCAFFVALSLRAGISCAHTERRSATAVVAHLHTLQGLLCFDVSVVLVVESCAPGCDTSSGQTSAFLNALSCVVVSPLFEPLSW